MDHRARDKDEHRRDQDGEPQRGNADHHATPHAAARGAGMLALMSHGGTHFAIRPSEVGPCREARRTSTPTNRSVKPSTSRRATKSAASRATKPNGARG